MNSSLTYFYRIENQESSADVGEKIGNFGLGLLRIGFGRTIIVETVSDSLGKVTFSEKRNSTCARLSALVLFFLALPVTILLACIGFIASSCSKSQHQLFNSYNQNIASGKTLNLNSTISEERMLTSVEEDAQKPLEITKENELKVDSIQNMVSVDKKIPSRQKRQAVDLKNPEEVATFIQSVIRGHFVRKSYLPNHLFPRYNDLCAEKNDVQRNLMPRAINGKTAVFLPKEMPAVILKASGRANANRRFHQMQEVRAVLKEQKSDCLVIPRANLCKNFLVEQRLPVNGDIFYNIELYLSNYKLFDKAVREFTRLSSKIYICDLLVPNNHPLAHIPDVEGIVRYDNLPFYIVNENGKQEGRLGLIDLEGINVKKEVALDSAELARLIRIFPYHKEVIIEEALKLNVKIDMDLLNASQINGEKYLWAVFVDHMQWLKEKKISTENSSSDFLGEDSIDKERIVEDIKNFFLHRIFQNPTKEMFQHLTFGNVKLKKLNEETPIAQEFAEKMTDIILHNLRVQIKLHQERELKNSQTITSNSQLVKFRSPVLNRETLYGNALSLLAPIEHRLFMQRLNAVSAAEVVTWRIMRILKETGKIFNFDPGLYGGEDRCCWIRY